MLLELARFERRRIVSSKKNPKRVERTTHFPLQLTLLKDEREASNNKFNDSVLKIETDPFEQEGGIREKRYNTILLEQDLFADWVITRVNGRIGTPLGHVRQEAYDSFEEGLRRFHKLCHYREKRKHYAKVNSYSYLSNTLRNR